jgi:hypothetical protein
MFNPYPLGMGISLLLYQPCQELTTARCCTTLLHMPTARWDKAWRNYSVTSKLPFVMPFKNRVLYHFS